MILKESFQGSESVVVKRIEPIGLTTEVATVSEIRLAERPADAPPGSLTPYGDFPMDPPVACVKGRCITQDLQPATNYLLEPGGYVAIAATIHLEEEGRFRIAGYRVIYEVDGKQYQQTVPTARSAPLKSGGIDLLDIWERRCIHLATPL